MNIHKAEPPDSSMVQQLAASTLKGTALTLAIETGLIPKGEKGYNVAPFLRFWDALSKLLKTGDNITDVVD